LVRMRMGWDRMRWGGVGYGGIGSEVRMFDGEVWDFDGLGGKGVWWVGDGGWGMEGWEMGNGEVLDFEGWVIMEMQWNG